MTSITKTNSQLMTNSERKTGGDILLVMSPPTERHMHRPRKKPKTLYSRSYPGMYDVQRPKPGRGHGAKHWHVTTLPKLGFRSNPLDESTIYSNRQSRLFSLITSEEEDMQTPLQYSPRFQQLKPDPGLAKERHLVRNYRYKLTPVERIADYTSLPSVYPESLECPSRRTPYVESHAEEMYSMGRYPDKHDVTKATAGREYDGRIMPPCPTPTSDITPRRNTRCHPTDILANVNRCQYCDVIGTKYCMCCQEFRNRQYAWCYEQQFLPFI